MNKIQSNIRMGNDEINKTSVSFFDDEIFIS